MEKRIVEKVLDKNKNMIRTNLYSSWEDATDGSIASVFDENNEVTIRFDGDECMVLGDGDELEREFVYIYDDRDSLETRKLWVLHLFETDDIKVSKSLSNIFKTILNFYEYEQFKSICFDNMEEVEEDNSGVIQLYDITGLTKENKEIEIGELFFTSV